MRRGNNGRNHRHAGLSLPEKTDLVDAVPLAGVKCIRPNKYRIEHKFYQFKMISLVILPTLRELIADNRSDFRSL